MQSHGARILPSTHIYTLKKLYKIKYETHIILGVWRTWNFLIFQADALDVCLDIVTDVTNPNLQGPHIHVANTLIVFDLSAAEIASNLSKATKIVSSLLKNLWEKKTYL